MGVSTAFILDVQADPIKMSPPHSVLLWSKWKTNFHITKFWDINTKLGLLACQINKKNKNKKMSMQLADSERREADRKTDLKKNKK